MTSSLVNQMPKINYASSMIVEDHLKKCLARTSNKPWKATDNKLLPRCNHSPFGDFPTDYMPGRKNPVTEVQPINQAEVSIAVKGTGKSFKSFYHLFSFSVSWGGKWPYCWVEKPFHTINCRKDYRTQAGVEHRALEIKFKIWKIETN